MTMKLIPALILTGVFSVTSAEQAFGGTPASSDKATVSSYAKPGAPIGFTHTVHSETAPGQMGRVTVKLQDTISSGDINVVVTGSEGLNISSRSTQVRFNSEVTQPEMDVYYSADRDGKYYINLLATAPDGTHRAHSIAVIIGDMAKVAPVANKANVTTTPEGRAVVILEAEETIH